MPSTTSNACSTADDRAHGSGVATAGTQRAQRGERGLEVPSSSDTYAAAPAVLPSALCVLRVSAIPLPGNVQRAIRASAARIGGGIGTGFMLSRSTKTCTKCPAAAAASSLGRKIPTS